MTIKGMDGQSYNVTGQGQGNFNTVGAAAGIASFLGINGGNILGRNDWGWNAEGVCSDNMPVSRYELNMVEQLNAKDSEIALLKADKYTDQKIVEAYKDLSVKDILFHKILRDLLVLFRILKDKELCNISQLIFMYSSSYSLLLFLDTDFFSPLSSTDFREKLNVV